MALLQRRRCNGPGRISRAIRVCVLAVLCAARHEPGTDRTAVPTPPRSCACRYQQDRAPDVEGAMHCYVGCVPLLFAVVCSCSGGASLDWVACERPTNYLGASLRPHQQHLHAHAHAHAHTHAPAKATKTDAMSSCDRSLPAATAADVAAPAASANHCQRAPAGGSAPNAGGGCCHHAPGPCPAAGWAVPCERDRRPAHRYGGDPSCFPRRCVASAARRQR